MLPYPRRPSRLLSGAGLNRPWIAPGRLWWFIIARIKLPTGEGIGQQTGWPDSIPAWAAFLCLKTAMILLPNEDYILFGDDGNAPMAQSRRSGSLRLPWLRLFSGGSGRRPSSPPATRHLRRDQRHPRPVQAAGDQHGAGDQARRRAVQRRPHPDLATPATSRFPLSKLLGRVDAAIRWKCLPGLVELIEAGETGKAVDDRFAQLLGNTAARKSDAIVLALHHYPSSAGISSATQKRILQANADVI